MIARSTVTRIVGKWAMRATVSDTNTAGVMGIIKMDLDAFSASAFPDPEVDDAAWIHHDTLLAYTGNILDAGNQWIYGPIDTGARRRLTSENDLLVLVVENLLTVNLQWMIAVRILLAIR